MRLYFLPACLGEKCCDKFSSFLLNKSFITNKYNENSYNSKKRDNMRHITTNYIRHRIVANFYLNFILRSML